MFAINYINNLRAIGLFVVIILSISFNSTGSTRIIDPSNRGPESEIMLSWAAELHRAGIDVVLGSLNEQKQSVRPRLGLLKGYKPNTQDWGEIDSIGWSYGFSKGVAGIMVAAKPEAHPRYLSEKNRKCLSELQDNEGCRFVQNWLTAERQSRVFLAFTKVDFDHALTVKKTLESQGYVVFIFLQGRSERAWAAPALVGEVFAQAAHRFVLDTQAARSSVGVAFEAESCERHLSPPFAPTVWSRAISANT